MRKNVSLIADKHRIRGVADNVWVTDRYVLKINFTELSAGDVRDFAINTFTYALNRTRWPRNIALSDPKIENGIFTVEFKRGLSLEDTSDAVAALRDFQGRLIGGLYRTSENFRDANLSALELPPNRHSIFDTRKMAPSTEAFPFCSATNEEFANEVTKLKKSIENEFGPDSIKLNIR